MDNTDLIRTLREIADTLEGTPDPPEKWAPDSPSLPKEWTSVTEGETLQLRGSGSLLKLRSFPGPEQAVLLTRREAGALVPILERYANCQYDVK